MLARKKQLEIQQPLFLYVIIGKDEQTGHDPSHGVCPGDEDGGVDESCSDSEVELPCSHIADEHEDHGSSRIPQPAHSAGIGAADGGHEEQGAEEPSEHGPRFDDCRISIEPCGKERGE